MIRVAIVGGGPGGIFTASLLKGKYKDSYQPAVFEACHRTGGKILTSQFDSAPVSYEAGVAELYNYAEIGPDPLLELVHKLGLKTVPMNGQTVVLDERILGDQRDIQRRCGRATLDALRNFRARCREAMPLEAWYEGNCHFDNTHPWAGRTFEEILDEVPDAQARKYLKVAAHSDLAAEPHLTNGLNGLKNVLMDVPGYIRLYSVEGGIEQIPEALRERLRHTRILVDCPVTRIGKNPDETYRVSWRPGGAAGHGDIEHEDFEVVFVALPHNWLGSIEWGNESLRKAMTRFIAYYDRPGHYLRVSVLFRKPFWRPSMKGSWFMQDAFGGCCVYDEGTRYDAGEFGVLSWLIAGTDALSMNGFDDEKLARMVMATLPGSLADEASSLFMEARVHRWPAAVSAQPGGLPVRDSRSAHLPDPREVDSEAALA
jgi:monoamine oxidase